MAVPVTIYENGGWRRMLPLVYSRTTCQLISGTGELLSQVRRLVGQSARDVQNRNRSLSLWCRPELEELVAEETGLLVNQPLENATLLLEGLGFWRSLPEVDPHEPSWVGTDGVDGPVACIWADEEFAGELRQEDVREYDRLEPLIAGLPQRDVSENVRLFRWPWELVNANAEVLQECWSREQKGLFGDVSGGAHLLNPDLIRIGAGSRVKPTAVLDAENGPVWIGNDVSIAPLTYIQGPVCIGDGCVIQPGAIIKPGTTIGPLCKVGGEIQASIIHGFSNKQHDGFLGNSYVGQWVNIAANVVCSNLKNTYGTVRVPIRGVLTETGELCVGLLIGDYSRIGIGVHFPTGAVVGFASCIATPSRPKFVPSFAWITEDGMEMVDVERGLTVAKRMMSRRGKCISAAQQKVFRDVAEHSAELELGSPRSWPRSYEFVSSNQ